MKKIREIAYDLYSPLIPFNGIRLRTEERWKENPKMIYKIQSGINNIITLITVSAATIYPMLSDSYDSMNPIGWIEIEEEKRNKKIERSEQLFDYLDYSNPKGILTLNEILLTHGEPVGYYDRDRFFKADTSGDDQISKREFINYELNN